AYAQDQLDRFSCLNHPDQTGENPEHSAFSATGDQAGRRRFGEEASIARTRISGQNRGLPFEPEDAAIHVRLAGNNAGIVHQVPGGEVVRAVYHNVVAIEDFEGVGGRKLGSVRLQVDVRVDILHPVAGGVELGPSDIGCSVQ